MKTNVNVKRNASMKTLRFNNNKFKNKNEMDTKLKLKFEEILNKINEEKKLKHKRRLVHKDADDNDDEDNGYDSDIINKNNDNNIENTIRNRNLIPIDASQMTYKSMQLNNINIRNSLFSPIGSENALNNNNVNTELLIKSNLNIITNNSNKSKNNTSNQLPKITSNSKLIEINQSNNVNNDKSVRSKISMSNSINNMNMSQSNVNNNLNNNQNNVNNDKSLKSKISIVDPNPNNDNSKHSKVISKFEEKSEKKALKDNTNLFLTNLLDYDMNINSSDENRYQSDNNIIDDGEDEEDEDEKFRLAELKKQLEIARKNKLRKAKLDMFQVGKVRMNTLVNKIGVTDFNNIKKVQSYIADYIKSHYSSGKSPKNLNSRIIGEENKDSPNVTILKIINEDLAKIDDIDERLKQAEIEVSKKKFRKSAAIEELNKINIKEKHENEGRKRNNSMLFKSNSSKNLTEDKIYNQKNYRDDYRVIDFDIENSITLNSNSGSNIEYKLFDEEILNALKNKSEKKQEKLYDKYQEKLRKIYKIDNQYINQVKIAKSKKYMDIQPYQMNLVEVLKDRIDKENLKEFITGLKRIRTLCDSVQKCKILTTEENREMEEKAKAMDLERKKKRRIEQEEKDYLKKCTPEEREAYLKEKKAIEKIEKEKKERLEKQLLIESQNIKKSNNDDEQPKRRFKSEWQITFDKIKDILPDKVVEKIKSVM